MKRRCAQLTALVGLTAGALVHGLGCSGGTGGHDATETDGTTTEAATTGPDVELGACAPAPGLEDLLYPLEVGRAWEYELSCLCDDETSLRVVTGLEQIGGREAFAIGRYTSNSYTEYFSQTGQTVERWDSVSETWETLISEPIEEGYEWGDSPVNHWEATPTVTSAAGTFSDCWTVVSCYMGDSCIDRVTYCPGHGPVLEDFFEITYSLGQCGSAS